MEQNNVPESWNDSSQWTFAEKGTECELSVFAVEEFKLLLILEKLRQGQRIKLAYIPDDWKTIMASGV